MLAGPGYALSEHSRGGSSLASLELQVVTRKPWCPLAGTHITPLSASIFTWHSPCVSASLCPNFPLLIRTLVTLDFRPPLILYNLILT